MRTREEIEKQIEREHSTFWASNSNNQEITNELLLDIRDILQDIHLEILASKAGL